MVTGDEQLRRLALEPGPLLIVAHDCSAHVARAVEINGHAVVLANPVASGDGALTLPQLDVRRAQVELERMGLPVDEAFALVRRARGELPGGPGVSLSAIRGELGSSGAALPRELAPLLLVGSWTDDEQDVALVCEVLGSSPDELRRLERAHSGEPGSPLVRLDHAWRVKARRVTWRSGPLLPADVDRLARVLEVVFVGGVRCSSELVRGLLEGLVLLAIEGRQGQGQQGRVDQIVASLLRAQGVEQWAKQVAALQSFVEAAPRVFANWVSRSVEDPAWGTLASMHWPLEILAWSDEHLDVAIDGLARLIDAKRSSQAFPVLCEIFRPWSPETSASEDIRMAVFETLDREYPHVAFEVLWKLMPSGTGDHGHHTSRPRYRAWADDSDRTVTWSELYRQYDRMCERLLALLHAQPERWLRILPQIIRLHPRYREQLVDALPQVDTDALTPEQREALRDHLRHLVHDARTFVRRELLSEVQLLQLVELHERLEPSDLRDALAWLFSVGPRMLEPVPFRDDGDDDREARELERREQLTAAQRLAAAFAPAQLVAYSHCVPAPWTLGLALGRVSLDLALRVIAAGAEAEPEPPAEFWKGLGEALFIRDGVDALQREEVAALPPERLAKLLRGLPYAPATWDLVDAYGPAVRAGYWRQVNCVRPDDSALERVVRALFEVGRPRDAASLAARKSELRLQLREDLLKALGSSAADEHEAVSLHSHGIAELLARVREEPSHDDAKLRQLEWILLPQLDGWHGDLPAALHAQLEREPAYFVEIVQAMYASAGEERERASKLMEHWRGLPGRNADGTLDAAALRAWVLSARAKLRALGLADIGEQRLGEVLARAPVGDDGRWPHEAVRELIEDYGRSEQLDMGIYLGRSNRRGPGIVDPDADREAAARLHEDAVFMRRRWPHTARIVERLADGKQHDAEFGQDHFVREREDWTPAATAADRLDAFLDAIVAKGRRVFDLDEAANVIRDRVQLRHVLSTSNKVAPISDDAYVIVEREYRTRGAPPPSWYLDELIRRAGLRYCVGLLSAAEYAGAADQRPQVFQVLVDRPHERLTIGGVPIQFVGRPREQAFVAKRVNTRTGTMLIAAPEATVFDLVEFERESGGSDHVVAVLEELGEELDVATLVEVAGAYPHEVVERAITRLDEAGHAALARSLEAAGAQ